MLPKHFYAKADGYLRKEYKANADLRKHCYLTILPHVDHKKISFLSFCEDVWPLELDDEYMEKPKNPLLDMTPEERKKEFTRIMQMHNPKRYGSPNGNGSATNK